MELIYLWVKEYKNIHHQGFNFSPRFECDFDGENLTIDEKKDYVNIFPENINVTAIVGENGSGKSSLLRLLMNKFIDFNYEESEKKIRFFAIYKYINPINKKIEFIFSNDDKDYSIKMNSFYFNNKSKNFLAKDEINKIMKNTVVLHYSPILSSENVDFASNSSESLVPQTKDISQSSLLNNRNLSYVDEKNYGDYSKTNFQSVLSSFDTYQKVIYVAHKYATLDLPFKMPKTIEIENIRFFNKLKHDSKKLQEDLENFVGSQLSSDSNKEDFISEAMKNIICVLLLSTPNHGTQRYEESNIKTIKKYDFQNFDELYAKYLAIINEIIEVCNLGFNINKYELKKAIKVFFASLKNVNEESFLKNKIKMNIEDKTSDLLKEYLKIINYIKQFLYIKWDKILSSGEEVFLNQFINLYYYLNDYSERNSKFFISKDSNIILCIDEGEVTLHPNWQKNYLNYLMYFIKNNTRNPNFHLILASHSPFILSDLAKGNVIFLEKVDRKTKENYPKLNIDDLKNGNCINVSDHVNIKPFGANIHTLLSDGFFIKDGLMGEFAKEKINDVIKYLNPKNQEETEVRTDKDAKNIIDIIGEPVLKNTLLNMYEEKVYKEESKLEKLKRKQQEIAEAIKEEEKKDKSNEKS